MRYKLYLKGEPVVYLKNPVPIPQGTKKIVFLKNSGSTYVYYQTGRTYNPGKKYTIPTRTAIGKVCLNDESKMFPNERFFELFPGVPYDDETERSMAIRVGSYVLIKKIIEELKLQDVLSVKFPPADVNFLLDLAAYTIVAEDNAGQYYPAYAEEHALFTNKMKVYSDSYVSEWLRNVTASQIIESVNQWNSLRNHMDQVYISYDSTNKNSHAGDVELVEFGEAKVKAGLPIINVSLAYDVTERVPAFYESYPGSIPDVSQLDAMIEKAVAYGYKNIGFILDRGYFSKENLAHLDERGYAFIIMIKGRKSLLSDLILEKLHTFENKSSCYIDRHDVFGCTVEAPLYEKDTKKRYIHLYHNAGKGAKELYDFNEDLRRMRKVMDNAVGQCTVIPKNYEEYFTTYYEEIEVEKTVAEAGKKKKIKEKVKKFIVYEEKEEVVERQRNLCGYFAIATSRKMTAEKALSLYKSRDGSEKLFRGDKSYLGDKTLRVYSTESTETKIFVEFIALIIRSRIYTKLHDLNMSLTSRLNYLTVPAAIKELEKIIMIKLPDGKYHLSYALTKTQKTILQAFGMTEDDVNRGAVNIAETLGKERKVRNGKTT